MNFIRRVVRFGQKLIPGHRNLAAYVLRNYRGHAGEQVTNLAVPPSSRLLRKNRMKFLTLRSSAAKQPKPDHFSNVPPCRLSVGPQNEVEQGE